MKAAVIQSSYIPWKGYFDFIHEVDAFIFFDDVEFSKGSWRNRNKIKQSAGAKWISVPVKQSGLNTSAIDQVIISDENWQQDHLNKISSAYRESPFFEQYRPLLTELYEEQQWEHLSSMNQHFTKLICSTLGITDTAFYDSRELAPTGQNEDRVIDLLKKIGASSYLSGPSAKNYMSLEKWDAAEITVEWKEYQYPEYNQLHPPFVHEVSVLDMLFNLGPETGSYIWGEK